MPITVRIDVKTERMKLPAASCGELHSPDWEIPAYVIPDIPPGTTQTEISHLRKPFTESDVNELIKQFGETYDWFLRHEGCQISVNEAKVTPRSSEAWAFPPAFEPRKATLTFPRFHRHLEKEECDEIGGTNDHEAPTAIHGQI